ncbi:MAG: tRNA (adenosine(37)-N6)-threonylcarbamoyltransferase complex ATPase subunit type 1 TsaE [Bacilli bacterium]|nr:tRNA (adenosine(37)-N6)-threonylcarbamoyltransferase complex ATPase subunit type 1 TsaE [Bacilli bacterium]
MNYKFMSRNKKDTLLLAKKLAKLLCAHDVVTLTGDLGAGKTTFVGGVLHTLGVKEDVISPTFNILKCYFDAPIPLYHIDAYRLEDSNKDIGLEEYIEGDGIALIEWPNFIAGLLKIPHLEIDIKNLGGTKRAFTLKAKDSYYQKKLKELA